MSKYSVVTSAQAEVLDNPISEAMRQWDAHGWGTATAGMAAVTTIARVNRILVSRVERALSPLGLTFARFEILRLLGFARDRQLPMGKIGRRLQVHPASVTSAVKRLERDNLIERAPASHDNRVVLARLLPKGDQILDQATMRINEVFESIELDEADLDMITGVLGAISSDETG